MAHVFACIPANLHDWAVFCFFIGYRASHMFFSYPYEERVRTYCSIVLLANAGACLLNEMGVSLWYGF